MSNTKTKPVRACIKVDVPTRYKDKLEDVSAKSGVSMTLIIQMLIEFYLGTPLQVERDTRRALKKLLDDRKMDLKLSERQKKVIQRATNTSFTDELL